ncbi:MAG TPA: hypothetical protein VK152_11235 [Paludibacter sp.]|nr:hypothetical protein [Paludibacter sp.]
MRKKILLLALASILCKVNIQAQGDKISSVANLKHSEKNASEKSVSKKVKCSVEIMPNYLWHLFAVANLWNIEKSDYADKYRSTVAKNDLDYLYQQRSLITWGNSTSGMFASFLFFTPFVNEMPENGYFAYLDALEKAAKTSEWLPFMEKYCPQYINQIGSIKTSSEDIEVFCRIKGIIVKNFSQYKTRVWPEEKSRLYKLKAKIDVAFQNDAMISRWESALNTKYPEQDFYAVLTYPNGIDTGLPSANDFSSSRDNFGVAENNIDQCIDLIIHEIGIFCMMPLLHELQSDQAYQTAFYKEKNVVYQAVESYIEYKKGGLDKNRVEWKGAMFNGNRFDFPFFFKYYEGTEGKYGLEQTLRMAIGEYDRIYNKK